jgi:SHS2 domain-containing protein
MKRYEQFPHTADIGVRVFGKDLKELFENAAFAMFDIMADLEGLTGDTVEEFRLSASDDEELLVAWLDELLYRSCTKGTIYYKFTVSVLAGGRLEASAVGRPVGANRNRLKTEIKAATYGGLEIRKSGGGYSVEIIFDV